MSIADKLAADITEAMKQKEAVTVSVLRMLKSALHNKAIELKKDVLSDAETLKVLGSEAKKRKDSIQAYEQGGRQELADKEQTELSIIKQYLPDQLSEEKISEIVDEVLDSIDQAEKNIGGVMKQVMARIQGQADGQAVSDIVKQKVNNS